MLRYLLRDTTQSKFDWEIFIHGDVECHECVQHVAKRSRYLERL